METCYVVEGVSLLKTTFLKYINIYMILGLYNINVVRMRRYLCNDDTHNDNNKKCNLDNKAKGIEAIEEPTACCMSGCANCVWLDYADKLNEYFKDGGEKALKEIEEKITDPNIKSFLLHEIRMRSKK